MAFALPVIGAVTSVVGTLEAGAAKANEMNYQAQVAENNAKIANQNAEYAINAGLVKAEKQGRRTAATLGRIKAAQAASGIDVNTGSAADVQESERATGKLDADTVLSNAQLEAYGYRSQGTSFQAQAGLDRAGADQARTGSEIGAVGSLLEKSSALNFNWSGAPTGGFASGASSLNTGNASGWDNPDFVAAP